jgi:hypothetical protein
LVIPIIKGNDLVLVNLNTGEVAKVVEAGVSPTITNTITVRGWTPDCVNVFISIRGNILVAWNVLDGRRVGQVSNAAMAPATLVVSPDGNYIFARPYRGVLLWELSTGKQYVLSSQGVASLRVNQGGAPVRGLTWDLERGQVLAVMDERANGVTAFNLRTGEVAAFYNAGDQADNITYQVVGNQLYTFSAEPGAELMRIHQRSDASFLSLDIEAAPGGRVRPLAYTEALRSPDGRFLAVSHRDIYLFDAAGLGPAPQAPTFRIEVTESNYPRLRFADANILEGYYFSSSQAFSVWRWDVTTGATLHQGQGTLLLCEDAAFRASYAYPSLVAWVCGES